VERGADPTIAALLVAAFFEGHPKVVRLLLGHPSAKTTIILAIETDEDTDGVVVGPHLPPRAPEAGPTTAPSLSPVRSRGLTRVLVLGWQSSKGMTSQGPWYDAAIRGALRRWWARPPAPLAAAARGRGPNSMHQESDIPDIVSPLAQ
jgi:hypothetical protein